MWVSYARSRLSIDMPTVGLEPTILAAADFKSAVYTNSTTSADVPEYVAGTLLPDYVVFPAFATPHRGVDV